MSTSTTLTHDDLQALVDRLDPRRADAPRKEWIMVGMVIYDADSGDFGHSTWEDFSRQSSKFKAKDCRAAWRSFRRGAGAPSPAKRDVWTSRRPVQTSLEETMCCRDYTPPLELA